MLFRSLAAIHGDGGQHAQRHGLERSSAEAQAVVARLRERVDFLYAENQRAESLFDVIKGGSSRVYALLQELDELRALENSRQFALNEEARDGEERGAYWAVRHHGCEDRVAAWSLAAQICTKARKSVDDD